MELRYFINVTQIEEPIGFDDLKVQLKRTKQHGVSAAVSVGDLEFFGVAAGLIKTAYETDIDTELIFKAEMKADGEVSFVEIYSGVIDLSTYIYQAGDYCSIKCKVGEVGVKTTFNNRIDTVVDLSKLVSLDGATLPTYPNLKKTITIPAKGILYATHLISNVSRDFVFTFPYPSLTTTLYWKRGVDSVPVADVGNALMPNIQRISMIDSEIQNIVDVGLVTGLPNITENKIKVNMQFTLARVAVGYSENVEIKLVLRQNGAPIHTPTIILPTMIYNLYYPFSFNFEKDIVEVAGENYYYSIYMQVRKTNGTNPDTLKINMISSSADFIKFEKIQVTPETTAPVALVHECFNRVAEITSGLTVKSFWYSQDYSDVNGYPSPTYGGGSLKALTSGYWLRNAINTSGASYNLSTSFKDLFNNLNAIDNIGWGLVKEDGQNFIRVERWDWFYKNTVILEINDVQTKRSLNPNEVFTRLKVGYEKYGDVQDVNSIDTFHTKREYSTKLKSVDNEVNAISKYIADPYAIEFTRRKALDKTTKDWKFDESTFILCLVSNSGALSVEKGITDSDSTIISPDTMVNARISPLRNAVRWAERFFEVKKASPELLSFTAGTGNLSAKGTPATSAYATCQDSIVGVGVENQNIAKKTPKLKPEILECDYPITRAQYLTIFANPYGTIKVNGESCWLSELNYDMNSGLTNFKLIPKA